MPVKMNRPSPCVTGVSVDSCKEGFEVVVLFKLLYRSRLLSYLLLVWNGAGTAKRSAIPHSFQI